MARDKDIGDEFDLEGIAGVQRAIDELGDRLVGIDQRNVKMGRAPNKFGDVRDIRGVDAAQPARAEFVRFVLTHPMPILIAWQVFDSAGVDVTTSTILQVRSSVRDAFVAEDVFTVPPATSVSPQIVLAQAMVITMTIPLSGLYRAWVVAAPMTSL